MRSYFEDLQSLDRLEQRSDWMRGLGGCDLGYFAMILGLRMQ